MISICLAYLIFTFREFKSIHKGKTAILHLRFGTEKNRRLGSKKARYNRAFRVRHLFCLHIMVGVRRFELPASWSRTKRSTELSHTPQRFSIIPLLFSVVKTKIKKLAHFGKKVSENKTPPPADPDEGEYHSPSLKSNFISSAENRYCMTSFATFLISSEAIYSTACRASFSGT